MGIGCLYLMGTLERDNGMEEEQGRMKFVRPKASPLAITCRQTPSTMLGGKRGFKELMSEAKKQNMSVIVDCVARVSSSRAARRYRDKFTYVITE